ncbi:MAG: hypothetical protein ABI692_12650 [Terracoccus sp.]
MSIVSAPAVTGCASALAASSVMTRRSRPARPADVRATIPAAALVLACRAGGEPLQLVIEHHPSVQPSLVTVVAPRTDIRPVVASCAVAVLDAMGAAATGSPVTGLPLVVYAGRYASGTLASFVSKVIRSESEGDGSPGLRLLPRDSTDVEPSEVLRAALAALDITWGGPVLTLVHGQPAGMLEVFAPGFEYVGLDLHVGTNANGRLVADVVAHLPQRLMPPLCMDGQSWLDRPAPSRLDEIGFAS